MLNVKKKMKIRIEEDETVTKGERKEERDFREERCWFNYHFSSFNCIEF